MRSLASLFLVVSALTIAACGPKVGGGADDDDDDVGDDDGMNGGPDASTCTPTPEICNNNRDDDCDMWADCDDADCEATCGNANCGKIDHPENSLALPDGLNVWYTSSINFTQFGNGQMLTDPNKLLAVCVNMEHTWLRDLQMEISCPSGQQVILQMFLGTTGGEIFMGMPNDGDGTNPVPGTGAEYCWTPTATRPPMLEWANMQPGGFHLDLPTGDYRSVQPWSQLQNCLLNGNWTFRVMDQWASDNGFIFSWGLKFDPSLVPDCSTWPPIG